MKEPKRWHNVEHLNQLWEVAAVKMTAILPAGEKEHRGWGLGMRVHSDRTHMPLIAPYEGQDDRGQKADSLFCANQGVWSW